MLEKYINEIVEFDINGCASTELNSFNQLPQEMRFRMLAKILQDSGGETKKARGERIERLIEKIAKGKDFKASTLAKCLIRRKKDLIVITPEAHFKKQT